MPSAHTTRLASLVIFEDGNVRFAFQLDGCNLRAFFARNLATVLWERGNRQKTGDRRLPLQPPSIPPFSTY